MQKTMSDNGEKNEHTLPTVLAPTVLAGLLAG
jgi:hypothetical protein